MTELIEQPSPRVGGGCGIAVRIIETRPVDGDTWRLLQAADNSWVLWMLNRNVQALVETDMLQILS